MPGKIKVSVIVPVYNGETHLRECLDSIVNQSLKEIEILLVDDGSTDSSMDILSGYAVSDDRIHIYQQSHQYAGCARNLGKSHAKGDYLAFWDCDDFFDLRALEKLLKRAEETYADVVVCGGNLFMEQKQKAYPWPSYLNMKRVPETETFNRFTNPQYYLNFTNAAAWNKLFKRDYIEKLNLDFQPVRNGNDAYFTEIAIGLADRIATVNEKLVTYRSNQGEGLVSSLSKSPLTPIQAWMDIAENLEKHDGFGERSFANKAVGSMLYLLYNLLDFEAFREAYEALTSYGLSRMHIQKKEGYYYSEWQENCVSHLYEDSAEQFALFLAHSFYVQKDEANSERRILNQEVEKLKKENRKLQEIKGSWSYRIGKMITWLPGKLKRLF